MPGKPVYEPRYGASWALVIGVNAYQNHNHLEYACNDARAVAGVLQDRFGFPADNIRLLTDGDATKAKILQYYLDFTDPDTVGPDDRIVIFFAGHGHTKTGSRGDVGFLVPVEANTKELHSFLRWDELTRYADLIPAKHVLFIMDACYGGLAVTRYLLPGRMRFLKNMLQRYSRQVLTAGKGDEVVSDADGPRPGHSIFTGHLLDALEGAAAVEDGVLTANAVMAYVYDRVANDQYSRQTPHYGFIDGDGDFVFNLPSDPVIDDPSKDKDTFIGVPAAFAVQTDESSAPDLVSTVKEYLSEPRFRIKLDDLVTAQTRRVLEEIGGKDFSLQTGGISAEDIAERLKSYERIVSPLQAVAALLGKWSSGEQRSILESVFDRLAEVSGGRSGNVVWLGLQWYPTLLLMYSGGIGALVADNYGALGACFTTRVRAGLGPVATKEVILACVEGMGEVDRVEGFKLLPGHDRHYAPRSEYLYKALQPALEDVFFLGRSYERLFDKFEVLLALVYADLDVELARAFGRVWGPVGRFGWKFNSRIGGQNPYSELRREANQWRDEWPPLKAGLFGGKYDQFENVATKFEAFLASLNWR
jgi:Caspase domain